MNSPLAAQVVALSVPGKRKPAAQAATLSERYREGSLCRSNGGDRSIYSLLNHGANKRYVLALPGLPFNGGQKMENSIDERIERPHVRAEPSARTSRLSLQAKRDARIDIQLRAGFNSLFPVRSGDRNAAAGRVLSRLEKERADTTRFTLSCRDHLRHHWNSGIERCAHASRHRHV